MNRALALAGAMTLAAATAFTATPALAAATVTTRVANLAVTPTTVTKGSSITLKGQAQKLAKTWTATPGASVVVFFDADGSAPNTAQRTLKADARGNFATSMAPQASGYWSVQLKATSTNKASTSTRVYVKVTAPAPSRGSAIVMPKGSVNCPSWAPIKGNASSHIFHRPGQRFYAKTHPEMCFSTPAAAIKAGYRASKI